ncbi:MAG: folate family ECF transporter S component [Eubacteriales bacterium]|nr:folate family ECF transporter S component [Eubacteriales bacterium]
MQKKQFDLRTLIVLALLAAIGAVFKAYVSVDLFFMGMKISDLSLIALPVMMAGIYYGPLTGGLVGFIAEAASFFMMPVGAYNPAFSVVMALTGVIAGLFYLKSQKTSLWKTILMVVLAELICSAILTTLLVHVFYSIPLIVLLPGRGIGILIKIPLLTMLIMILVDRLRPVVIRHNKKAASE